MPISDEQLPYLSLEENTLQTESLETSASKDPYVSSVNSNSEVVITAVPDLTDQSQHVEIREYHESEPKRENWFNRHKLKLSLGAFALGLAFSPINKDAHMVEHAAPWAAIGLAGSEVTWISGAAVMLASVGKKVGNPLKVRSKWEEIKSEASGSPAFKLGLAVNSLGALGTAGVVAVGAVTALPIETWPGAIGFALADAAGTVAIRKGIYNGMRESIETENLPERDGKVKIRHAEIEDVDRLADIDLLRFRGSYGAEVPPKQEVIDMFVRRLENAPGWMFVAEVDGTIEGFVTAFRTNKPIEDFESWEKSTANGTLDGKVDPKGKYAYIVNLTMNPDATKSGAMDSAIANLYANAIRDGVEYGYFISRMPLFKRWVESRTKRGELPAEMNEERLVKTAEKYASMTRKMNGKQVKFDYELRMYEEMGMELGKVVPHAFEDSQSMDFGVVCRADVPPRNRILRHIKPARVLMSSALRQVAKNPKLLRKVL